MANNLSGWACPHCKYQGNFSRKQKRCNRCDKLLKPVADKKRDKA